MDRPTAAETADHPLLAAVDAAETAVEHLIKLVDDGAHTDLGAFSLVEVLRHVERVRNKLPVVDGALIQYGTEQGAPEILSERSMVGVLVSGLRVSAGEASRRVRAAEHLAERRSPLGEPLLPIREHLARAHRDGLVAPEQIALIDGALRKVGALRSGRCRRWGGSADGAGHPARLQGPADRGDQGGRGHRPGRRPAHRRGRARAPPVPAPEAAHRRLLGRRLPVHAGRRR